MTYAAIIRKKMRMCARFGHLAPAYLTSRASGIWRERYYCRRCGGVISVATRREVHPEQEPANG